jgi:hypothetical protein
MSKWASEVYRSDILHRHKRSVNIHTDSRGGVSSSPTVQVSENIFRGWYSWLIACCDVTKENTTSFRRTQGKRSRRWKIRLGDCFYLDSTRTGKTAEFVAEVLFSVTLDIVKADPGYGRCHVD